MRARYYEPIRGRFISEDPSRDGSNWYTYANNEPISNADPSGRFVMSTAKFLLAFLKQYAKLSGGGAIACVIDEVHDENGNINFLRITLKTAQGVVFGSITGGTWNLICSMYSSVQEFGRLHAMAGIVVGFYCAYATLLLLVLDAMLYEGSESLIDALAPS